MKIGVMITTTIDSTRDLTEDELEVLKDELEGQLSTVPEIMMELHEVKLVINSENTEIILRPMSC